MTVEIGSEHALGYVRFAARAPSGEPVVLGIGEMDVISAALTRWSQDPLIYAVVIDGDLAAARFDTADVPAIARASRLLWQADCFTKPIVPLMRSACAGAAWALSLCATHRVAADSFSMSADCCSLRGLADPVGLWRLSQLPRGIGRYIALTGVQADRGDAYALGLISHCISSEHFSAIAAALADADPVDPLLDDLHVAVSPGAIGAHLPEIAACFDGVPLDDLPGRLDSHAREARSSWARSAHEAMSAREPFALAVVDAVLERMSVLALREAIELAYAISAALPSRSLDVDRSGPTADIVRALLETRPASPLDLPERSVIHAVGTLD
jgi:enoyl-CoA hydratase